MRKTLITQKRRGLWARLIVFMVVTLMTATWVSAQKAQIIGGESYATIQEAINAASNGQTVMMLANSTENITVVSGKSVILDLNGKILRGTGTNSIITVEGQGRLILRDSSDETHCLTKGDDGIWTWNDAAPKAGLKSIPAGGAVVAVSGSTFRSGKGVLTNFKTVEGMYDNEKVLFLLADDITDHRDEKMASRSSGMKGDNDNGLVDDDPLPAQSGTSSSMKYEWLYYYNEYWEEWVIGYGFDIKGIHNGNIIQTTYGNFGYGYNIKVGDVTYGFCYDDWNYGDSPTVLGKVYTYDGIQVKQHISLIDDGQVVKFGYTLYNNSSEVKTVKIGNHTDTQIGDNDWATVHLTNAYQKISMVDSHSAGYCTSAGLEYTIKSDEDSPFNGAYIGHYYDTYFEPYYFSVPESTADQHVYNTDSGLAFHWVRTLQPGQTTTVWCYFKIAPALVVKSVTLTADAETSQVHFDIPYKDFPDRTQTLYYVLQPEEGKPEVWKTREGNTTPESPEDIDNEGFVHRSFTFSADVTEWPSNEIRYIDLYAIDNMGYRSKDYHFEVFWPEWTPQQTYSTVYFKNTVKNLANIHGLIGETIKLPIDESDDPGMTFGGWNDKADGSGNGYAGGASFTIPDSDITLYAQWKISPDALTYINEDQYYTGQEIREIKVKYGTTIWEEGIDYNITYTNNINVGQASATITSDKLSASKTLHFNIMKVTNQWVTTPSVANVPLGTEVTPVSEAIYGTATVTYEGTGTTTYGPSEEKPTAAGYYKATFTVEQNDNYSPTLSSVVNFTIYVAEVLSGTTVLGAYATVQDAVNAANNGNTVRIGCDIAENIVVNRTGKTITLDLNGKTLKPAEAGSIINAKTALTIDDSSEEKTGKITTDGTSLKAHGLYVEANVTMNNGTITAQAEEGGGVYVASATFTMNGGVITGCTADTNGGGVEIAAGTFTMKGGTITGNTATGNGSGVYFAGGTMNVGGTAKIHSNTGSNVYLYTNSTMTVNTPFAEGAQIYVTTSTAPTTAAPVAVTSNGAASDVQYFKSDNAQYATIYKDNKVKLAIKGDYVCQIVETGIMYTTVQAGVGAATTGQTVQMINNSNENVTVSGKTLTLDLNGKVLRATSGSVISNSGTLTITDSDAEASHNFKVDANGLWTLTDETATIAYEELNERPAENTVVAVKGGCITGGTGTLNIGVQWGGGVFVSGTNSKLNMYGGNIIGNSVTNEGSDAFGGGVCVRESCTFNMYGGRIVGNRTSGNMGHGAGIEGHTTDIAASVVNITDGDISFNTTSSGNGGAAMIYGNFVMSGGSMRYNSAYQNGGAITFNDNSTATMTGGTIIGNVTVSGEGGGICVLTSAVTLGGDVVVTGNKKGDVENNVYIPNSKTITVSSLTEGANIGVTTQNVPTLGNPVAVTSNGETSDMAYFVSDNKAYVINYDTDHLVLSVPACTIYDGETLVESFKSIQEAIDANVGDNIILNTNTNEDIVIPEDREITLDLNGYVVKGTGSGPVITNEGTLHLKDTDTGGQTHKFSVDETTGLWTLDEESGTKQVTGGCITGGNGDNGGGVYNTGVMTMEGGNIVGNQAAEHGGGLCNGDDFSTDCSFTMTEGAILGNVSSNNGGGLGAGKYCEVNLLGGSITDNTAANHGGGVESGNDMDNNSLTIGGDMVINDNKNGTKDDNLYLYKGFEIAISQETPLTDDAQIGITTQNAPTATVPVPVTSNGTEDDMEHFSSDDDSHQLNYAINHIELSAPFVCELYDVDHTTFLSGFSCVQSAVNMATDGQLVKMIDNSEENVRVYAPNNTNFTLTLDLNGHVLDAYAATSGAYIARPAISVYNHVVLNIIDSNPDAANYFTVEETTIGESTTVQKWTLNTTMTEGTDWTTLTARPAVGDNIMVKGGIITGGDAFFGGGIDNKGTVNMSAGAIVGNIARNSGGGINTRSFTLGIPAATNLSGTAAILGNWSDDGGGICAGGDSDNTGNGDITMTGNSRISFNTSAGNGGGLWMIRNASICGNSMINYNAAATDGGGIYFEEAKQTTAGSLTIGNAIAVKDNIGEGDKTSNLFLDENMKVTVGTGDYALADDVVISVLVTEPSIMTTAASIDNTQHFTSENPAYGVYNNGKDDNQSVYFGNPVALVVETNYYYLTLQDAINAAEVGETVKMICNVTENVTIAADKDVTLDLNDCVLAAKANCVDETTSPKKYLNRAILVEEDAKLVIKDGSATKTTRYITKDTSDPTIKNKFIVTETPNDSIVTGGLITGGWTNVTFTDGIGILNNGTLTINGGTIAGNSSFVDYCEGAGVCNKGIFTMTDGELCYNMSTNGGGFSNKDNTVATITGGKIHHNKSYNGGGVINSGTLIMEGGEIFNNTVTEHGGGVENKGAFTLSGGKLYRNIAVYGGGVDNINMFTMSNGEIYENTGQRGGGVCNIFNGKNAQAKFTMTDGKIYDNQAQIIGSGLVNIGEDNPAKAVVTILGGEITGNTGSIGSIAGGLANLGTIILGNNVKISNNKVNVTEDNKVDNNLVVMIEDNKKFPITISTDHPLVNTEAIGVSIFDVATMSYTSGIFTTPCDITNMSHFTGDGDYEVTYRDDCLVLGNPVAYVVETNYHYDAVQEAINVAADGKTVKLIKNVTENVVVADGKVVILDLNGFELSATSGTVITNNGTLTLIDNIGGGNVTGGTKGVQQNGSLTLGGKVRISGNTEANLYLPENKVFSVGTGDYAPASGMMVYVTPFKWESGCIIPVSTENGTNDYSQYFRSDNEANHFVVYTDKEDNNTLKITDDVKILLSVDPEGVAEVMIFDAGTGLPIEDPTHIHYGTMVTIKVMSTDPDWTFTGWYNNSGTMFSGKYEYTFKATQNLNLTAKFTDAVIWVRVKKSN